MACTHCEHCELYTQFALNPALQVWQQHYCQGEFARCVRFQKSLRKESVPLNMLPNGTVVELPRSSNDYNATALFNAILKGRVPMVQSLLKQGIDVNVRNSDGMTPLMAAASTGSVEIVRMLLARGANAGLINSLGETAATVAIRLGHQAVAALCHAAIRQAPASPASKPATGKQEGGWLSRLLHSH